MRAFLSIAFGLVLAGCSSPKTQVAVVPTLAPTLTPSPTVAPIVIQSNEPAPPAMGGPIDTPRIVSNAHPSARRNVPPLSPTQGQSFAQIAQEEISYIDGLSENDLASYPVVSRGTEMRLRNDADKIRSNFPTKARQMDKAADMKRALSNYARSRLRYQQRKELQSDVEYFRAKPLAIARQIDRSDF